VRSEAFATAERCFFPDIVCDESPGRSNASESQSSLPVIGSFLELAEDL
jgi:hypothetical protein